MVTFSVAPETQRNLKRYAHKRGLSYSGYIDFLIRRIEGGMFEKQLKKECRLWEQVIATESATGRVVIDKKWCQEHIRELKRMLG